MSYTEQELFDRVVGHLAQQKVKSAEFSEPTALYPEGRWACLYRGPNNTQCAFGVLIPDSVYSSKLEGCTCNTILDAVKRKASTGEVPVVSGFHWALTPEFMEVMTPLVPHATLLSELQSVHDSEGGPDSWGMRFEEIAKYHGLQFDRAAFEHQMKAEQ